jgi:hypothetical protein
LLLPARENAASQTEVISKEYLEDGILFVQLYMPKASYSYGQQEATFVFVKTDWFYFVSYVYPSRSNADRLTKTEIQSYLGDFYQACEFKR